MESASRCHSTALLMAAGPTRWTHGGQGSSSQPQTSPRHVRTCRRPGAEMYECLATTTTTILIDGQVHARARTVRDGCQHGQQDAATGKGSGMQRRAPLTSEVPIGGDLR